MSSHCNLSKSNPIELPEIAAIIATHLSYYDLTICIRVSKLWHNSFASFIWEDVFFDNPPEPSPLVTDSQDSMMLISPILQNNFNLKIPERVISKYASSIKSLSVFGNLTPEFVQINFSSIKFLSLRNTITNQSGSLPSDLTQIISKCPTIEKLQLSEVHIADSNTFWKTLSNTTMLKSLQLSCADVPPDGGEGFWKTFSRLEKFSVYSSTLPEIPSTFAYLPNHMKNLSFNSVKRLAPIKQLEVISKCRSLEYLFWTEYSAGNRLSSEFSKTFSTEVWPSLHKLTLTKIQLHDEDLQLILSCINVLTELKPTDAEWSNNGFTALSRHFNTLEVLEVNSNPSFNSVMVNTVLSSSPNLITLSARMIKGLDIVNNHQIEISEQPIQGWKCRKLRNLSVHFDLSGLNSQMPILERIADLTQLESLDISNCELLNRQSKNLDWGGKYIHISLEDGLDILRPLKQLRELRFNDLRQDIGKSEVEWFAKYWKSLQSVFGEVHYDENKCRDVRQMLKKKRIEGYQ